MDTDLHAVKATLAEIPGAELRALIDATKWSPADRAGIPRLIEAACDWELNGRVGLRYKLQPLGMVALCAESIEHLRGLVR
jgi:hypothetical protein